MSLNSVVVGLAILLSATCAFGQYPPAWRSGSPAKISYKLLDGEHGQINVTADGQISRMRTSAPRLTSPTIAAPFEQTRAIIPFAGTEDFLVSGWRSASSEAVVVRVRLDDWPGTPIQFVGTPWVLPSRDIVEMVWSPDEEVIYVVDGMAERLEYVDLPADGPWPAASSFTAIASGAEVFGIERFDRDWYSLLVGGPQQVSLWNRAGVTHVFTQAGGQWIRSDVLRGSSAPPNFRVFQSTHVNARGPITMMGPTGSFDIVDVETQGVVFSANLTGVSWNNIVVPQGSLRSGRVYSASRLSVAPARFVALDRFGDPLDVDETRLGVPLPMHGGNVVGSDSFGVATAWTAQEGAGLPMAGEVYLWLVVTAPGETDPVVFVDSDSDGTPDAALLVGAASGPARLKSLSEESAVAFIADPLQIPDDENLIDSRVWFQYVVAIAGSPTLVSEVSSVPIEGGSASRRAGSVDAVARRVAIRSWLNGYRDAAGQTKLRAIHREMRRSR